MYCTKVTPTPHNCLLFSDIAELFKQNCHVKYLKQKQKPLNDILINYNPCKNV